MARYRNPIKQDVVDMYSPINVGYYKNIMDTAQGNLNQATMMGAKFMEDAYGNKYIDPKARDLYIGKAQEMIAQGLNEDFQTPARMASIVLKASQSLAPWKNLNEKQLELAKQAEQFKLQHGANAWVTDPSKESLLNPDGSLKSPEQLKFEGINAEDIDKRFIMTQKEMLDKPYYEAPTKIGAPTGKLRFVEGKGLVPEEIADLYNPITGKMSNQVAEQIVTDTPALLSIYGSKEAAMEAVKNRNYQTAGSYGYSRNTQFMRDDEYLDPLQAAQLRKLKEEEQPPFDPNLPSRNVPIVPGNVKESTISDKLNFVDGKISTVKRPPSATLGSTAVSGFGAVLPPGVSPLPGPTNKRDIIDREQTITQLSTIRKNTGYDQIKPGAMTYPEYKAMATKNGLSTKEDAYRNWLEKGNFYVVPSEKLAKSYDKAVNNYSKVGNSYKVVSEISGNSYMDMIGADLASTRAYVAGADNKTSTWENVADNLGLSLTELNDQLDKSSLRVAGITGRSTEPGMAVFNLRDDKGKSHVIYGSTNVNIAEGMKLSHNIHKNILEGKSGIVTDETGEAITHQSSDPNKIFVYTTDPQLDVNSESFNPVINRVELVWDSQTRKYVETGRMEPTTLDAIENLEIKALKRSGLIGTNLDQVTKEKPN